MTPRLIITNRTPVEYPAGALPRRIHIVPRGELPNREAGLVQVLDDAALDSILADLQSKAARGGLYLGEEHFIYNDEKSSQAFAWAKEFERDAQGIWAVNPEWSDVGSAAIRNKRFKWTSFVADRQDTQDLGNGRVRILKIDTVGFTNQANGKELLSPVVNRQPDFANASASAVTNQQPPKKGPMKNIALKLGLAAEASEEAILAELTKLQEKAGAAATAETENAELKNRLALLDGEQVDSLLAEHALKDAKQIARLKPALLPLKNRAERVEFLADLGFKPAAAKTETGRVLNRGDLTKTAGQAEKPALTAEQSSRIKNRADELRASNPGRRYNACWKQAEEEVLAS